MTELQNAKALVRQLLAEFDHSETPNLLSVLKSHTAAGYHWRGVHPFHELDNHSAVIETIWSPMRKSFTGLQRRMDMFFAGVNNTDHDENIWVVNAGHFMGLFDENWLGIPSTGRLVMIPYAEFHCVAENKIQQSALFLDILSVMDQAGVYPLPPMTGASFIYPGPKTHDGLLFDAQDDESGIATLDLVNRMVADLSTLNQTGLDKCPPAILQKTWHDDMVWFGGTGIGATYTIPRYQIQHQYPFRENLTDKKFNGHIARIGEGNYCGFFGWPNLNNRNKGGFMGLPGSDIHAPMRVVDLYRRDGEKLSENWVYFDFLHYLNMQGLDVLKRCRELNRT